MKVFEAVERIGRSSTRSQRPAAYRSTRDYLNGLNLYRANMPGPFLAPGKQLPQTTVPVQVLVARQDYFVSPALQRFTGSIPPGSRVIPIEGGHWVVSSRPDVIARLTSEWVDRVIEGAPGAGESVVHTGPRDVRGKLALVTGAGAGIGRPPRWSWPPGRPRRRGRRPRPRQRRTHRRRGACSRRGGRGLPGRRQRRSGDE
ncbi:alpha/beta hydrolase family protein [Mycobacterium xenopi 3993]|nr:alpha/beta hydrolase family protein [Mycobacterium xenopi 3993]